MVGMSPSELVTSILETSPHGYDTVRLPVEPASSSSSEE
jgi:hypothetical protein